MGLDACVPVADVMHHLGSYGWYHSFRLTVCNHLEGGEWGSKYPLLMNHSDCDGEYSPEESQKLLLELKDIKEKFKHVRYPVNICKDKDGNVTDTQEAYAEDGTFCYSNGFSFGAHEKGIVVIVSIYPHWGDLAQKLQKFVNQYPVFNLSTKKLYLVNGEKSYVAYFDKLEFIRKNGEGFWHGISTSGTTVDFPKEFRPCCPPETVLIERGTVPALAVFKPVIDWLIELAKASVKVKQPIIFF